MRSAVHKKQDLWFVEFAEENIGMNRVKIYQKPFKIRATVSATSGLVSGLGAGWSLKYDRDITTYDRSLRDRIKEGMAVFVDVIPKLTKEGALSVDKTYLTDGDGSIIYDEDSEPTLTKVVYETEPDYIVEKIYDTLKGKVARYAIKKV